ncbi:MAG: hypothetical protein IAF38_14735 [Bacteroidia bacterium]|nr:hypothetical protein [Bacteroidia bacterium]
MSKSCVFPSPFFKTILTTQERVIGKRFSTVTTVKASPPHRFLGSFLNAFTHGDQTYNPFSSSKLSCIGNITEFRIYGKKKGGLHGFYFGPYTYANTYKLTAKSFPAEFHDDAGVLYKADLSEVIKVSTLGGGFEIGISGLIKNIVNVDWTIFGIGLGSMKVSGEIEATNTSANFDFRNYDEDVQKTTLGIKFLDKARTVEKERISMGVRVPWFLFRTSLSFGIAY